MHTSKPPSSIDTVACTKTLILLVTANTRIKGPTRDMRSSATSGSAHPHHPTHTVSLLPSTSLERSTSRRIRDKTIVPLDTAWHNPQRWYYGIRSKCLHMK